MSTFASLLPRCSRFCLLAGLAMPVAGLTGLQAADWQSLVANSPFGQAATTTASVPGELEFRAVVQEDGAYLVNIYNPGTKTAEWVQVNGSADGIDVKAYDPATDRLQITQAGRPLTLALKQAKVSFVANVVPPPAPPEGEKPAEGLDKDEAAARRAQIRELIRTRMDGSNGNAGRTLPPEAQAMIEEFRRRRAGGTVGPRPLPAKTEP
jgi:hypothetical protein